MTIDVVIGGQGGDEGKGKVCAYLAKKYNYNICMRVPAPQAGHSIYYKGKRIGLSLLPCGLVNENSRLLIGTGGLISLEKLVKEISDTELKPGRLGIDYMATIVTEEHKQKERDDAYLMGKVGSVGTGVGPCRVKKIMRSPDLKFAKDIPNLKIYLIDTKKEALDALRSNKSILLEGDHGAKLDLIHGEYPFVTSRATNAAGFLSEAGLPIKQVRDIYLVLKPYVTRVAPGDLEEEIFDEKVLDWAHSEGGETGTVSKRSRRLGKFELEKVKTVIKINSVNKLVITHMDCPDYVWGALGFKDPTEFLQLIKEEICKDWPYPELALLSSGPNIDAIKECE